MFFFKYGDESFVVLFSKHWWCIDWHCTSWSTEPTCLSAEVSTFRHVPKGLIAILSAL